MAGGRASGSTRRAETTTRKGGTTAPPATNAQPPANSAPTTASPATDASFASVNDASAALDRAVLEYQRASQYIAANNLSARTRDSAAIYRARAEALEKIVNRSEERRVGKECRSR